MHSLGPKDGEVSCSQCSRSYNELLYKWFSTLFHDGILNRRQVSVCDRGGGPSHKTQKPGIGRHDAYSCPYKTISDISNIRNASSLKLVCARIAI